MVDKFRKLALAFKSKKEKPNRTHKPVSGRKATKSEVQQKTAV